MQGVLGLYAVIEVQRIVRLPTSNHFLDSMEQIQWQKKIAFSMADQLVTRYLIIIIILSKYSIHVYFFTTYTYEQYSYTGE